jgi:hypothetical protein
MRPSHISRQKGDETSNSRLNAPPLSTAGIQQENSDVEDDPPNITLDEHSAS